MKNNIVFVVATEKERKKFVPDKKYKCIVTGVGYANVFKALKDLPRNIEIINVGYAGSNCLKAGSICGVSESRNYHPNCSFEGDKVYKARRLGIPMIPIMKYYPCYTSGDFVLNTKIEEPVVFDMELYAIFAMGFKHVSSLKYITDNLSEEEYNRNTK